MRRCSHDKYVITVPVTEDASGKKTGGQIIGVCLGWDFVSEHEWGISRIRHAFGLPDKPREGLVGAAVRTITKVPDELKFFKFSDAAYLVFSSRLSYQGLGELTAQDLDSMLHVYDKDEELCTAWSESSFGVRIKNDALDIGNTVLGQIYDAFTKCDAMIFFSGRSAFGNRGLVIMIRSRVPEDALKKMKEGDEEYLRKQKEKE